MFERIDKLVTKEGFSFQAWDDRYSKGVWAALGTGESEVDVVRDLSSAGDLDMDAAMEYLFSAEWLPYVTGRTLHEAMTKLEEFLASLPADQLSRSSDWASMVYEAIHDLRIANREATDYGDLSGRLSNLPRTFEEALSKHQNAN